MKKKELAWLAWALLVAGPAWAGDFVDNGDGTVLDNKTGLMWQKMADNNPRTWENAISYCEGLELADHTDWRLPNIKELESITDDNRYNPAIDTTYFPETKSSDYWASTTYAYQPAYACYVSFYQGYVDYDNKSYSTYARCVRGG